MLKICVRNLQKKVLLCPQGVKKLIKRILKEEKAGAKGEITVSFISDIAIRKLNKKYLKKDAPTDVLAFDTKQAFNKKGLYADIVVSFDTAVHNSRVFGTTPSYELNLYVTHGLLHLLGYSHNLAEKKKVMLKKELKYAHT